MKGSAVNGSSGVVAASGELLSLLCRSNRHKNLSISCKQTSLLVGTLRRPVISGSELCLSRYPSDAICLFIRNVGCFGLSPGLKESGPGTYDRSVLWVSPCSYWRFSAGYARDAWKGCGCYSSFGHSSSTAGQSTHSDHRIPPKGFAARVCTGFAFSGWIPVLRIGTQPCRLCHPSRYRTVSWPWTAMKYGQLTAPLRFATKVPAKSLPSTRVNVYRS